MTLLLYIEKVYYNQNSKTTQKNHFPSWKLKKKIFTKNEVSRFKSIFHETILLSHHTPHIKFILFPTLSLAIWASEKNYQIRRAFGDVCADKNIIPDFMSINKKNFSAVVVLLISSPMHCIVSHTHNNNHWNEEKSHGNSLYFFNQKMRERKRVGSC